MIKAIVGGVGSGKTLSAIALMVQRKNKTFSNITARLPFVEALKISHIMLPKTDKTKAVVNWEFWKEQLITHKGFDIFLDELHNIAHARRAMSSWNINMSIWIAQVRKILGQNEKHDIVLISQRVERIDVAFRDLLHEIIYCQKVLLPQKVLTKIIDGKKFVNVMLPKIVIIQYHFVGEQCVQKYEAFRMGIKSYNYRTTINGNELLQFFNSYEIVSFGESEYL